MLPRVSHVSAKSHRLVADHLGDPFDTSIILWTRAVPTDSFRIDVPQCVEYKVYSGENGEGDVVSKGYSLTSSDVDYTVKVSEAAREVSSSDADDQIEATGLSASTWYSYQFSNCANPDNKSPIGKTRTAPGKRATDVATQRFAIYSCSNYPK